LALAAPVVTRGDRGRAGEPAAYADEAERDQKPDETLLVLMGAAEGEGWIFDALAEGPERDGLAAVYARLEHYDIGGAEQDRYEALVRMAEAWLAQRCRRPRQDCLPGHVTAFMDAVFMPRHQDSLSASGAPCCAPRTVQRALDHLCAWFAAGLRPHSWCLLAERSTDCARRCNPVRSEEVAAWQLAHESSVVYCTDYFGSPAVPATAAAGAPAGAAAPLQQGGGAAAAWPGQGGAAGPGRGGAAGPGQGGAAAAGFPQGGAAAAARPARRAAVRPRQGGAVAPTDAECVGEMGRALGGRKRPRAAAAVPPTQPAEAGQARLAPARPAPLLPRVRRPGQAAAAAGASHARGPGGGGARAALRAWPQASPELARRVRVLRLHAGWRTCYNRLAWTPVSARTRARR